ncbi:AlbA family DNA-binding domain-containing protein [Psittacicella gerlachiana]|uniref:Schlafen AlbA-2 domain-containing protein n=1 Tax=Psittacicella gerlachiana TaxID=2028574 RepID=A0A3A1YN37_9GAMM|nr:RNA-binding domain-containing protein [Psittacicella gerlachiana]RIY37447.1 hypothetical protein CKF59_01765 [Psittacicella gerlachiana]
MLLLQAIQSWNRYDRVGFIANLDVNNISDEFYQTLVALSNSPHGGSIVLGLDADKNFVGFTQEQVEIFRKNYQEGISNLISPKNMILDTFADCELTTGEYQGLFYILIIVPRAPTILKYQDRIYLRSAEGKNHDISHDQETVFALAKELPTFYHESALTIHQSNLKYLDPQTIAFARERISAHTGVAQPQDDLEFLKSLGLLKKNPFSLTEEEEVLNLAAFLLFGKKEAIKRLVPEYCNKLLLCRYPAKPGKKEEIIEQNLIESFKYTYEKICKHLDKVHKYPQETKTTDLGLCLQEALANSYVHRSYEEEHGFSVVDIAEDKVIFINAISEQSLIGFERRKRAENFIKNPLVYKVFSLMGYLPQHPSLGSGLALLYELGEQVADETPEIYEFDDYFAVAIFLKAREYEAEKPLP